MNKRIVSFAFVLAAQALNAQKPTDVAISELPSGVPSTEGKVTLFADYSRAKKSSPIDVYLINRSDRDITLSAQDGDVYLKLEGKSDDGTWTRVQPHAYSWCGNSYDFKPRIRKGFFYRIAGYKPKAGKTAKIRYRLYMQEGLELATEAGDGLISDDDAKKAASDALAVSTGSFEFVRDLATGAKKLVNTVDHIRDLQGRAIRTLGAGRFPKDKVLPVLDEIEKKFPAKRQEVNFARQLLEAKQEGAQ